MQAIEQLNLYYQFTKCNVFDKLYTSITNQSAIFLTAHTQLEQQVQNTSAQIALLIDQKPSWKNFGPQIETFIDIFAHYKQYLEQECSEFRQKMQKVQESMLIKLEQVELGYSSVQVKLLKHCYEQLDKDNQKIRGHQKKLQGSKKQIQSYHEHCFVRMLEFARDLNESNIKKKTQQKQYDLNTYGKMSSQMKRYLVEEINCLEDQIIQEYKNIRNIQLKQQKFIGRALRAFYTSDQAKMSTLIEIADKCSQTANEYPKTTPYNYLVEVTDVPRKGKFSRTQRMENAVHLTLHPISPNELILKHRQSLSFLLEKEFQLDQNGHIEVLEKEIKGENSPTTKSSLDQASSFKCPLKQPDQPYSFQKIFLTTFHFALEGCSIKMNSEELEPIIEELKKSLKFPECRSLVIFYVFYQIKQHKIFEEESISFLVKMCNQCLKEAFNRFDSQAIIKLLIVSIQMTPTLQQSFYKQLDVSAFSQNFQFWETTFIQNIYEYCEIMVNYYGQVLQEVGTTEKQGFGKFWDMLKFQNWLKLQNRNQPQKASIKDIYHEIIKNTFLVYISIMRAYSIAPEVIDKLSGYILTAIGKLDFPEKQSTMLQKRLQQIRKVEIDKAMSLLLNKKLVERSLSKLFGPSEVPQDDDHELSSLNQSIVQWQNENQL